MIKPNSPRGLSIPEPEFFVRWAEFIEKNPTNAHATENIVIELFGTDLCCYFCKRSDVTREWGSPKVKCDSCWRTTFLFANTFFEKAEHIKAYAAAVWLKEQGIGISKNRFARYLGLYPSTGNGIMTKLDHLIALFMNEDAALVPSSLLQKIFVRRSSQTAAGRHPRSEQEEIDNEESSCSAAADSGSGDVSADAEFADEYQRTVFDVMSSEPIDIDSVCESTGLPIGMVLSAITMLRIDKRIREVDFDRFVRIVPAKSVSTNVPDTIPKAEEFISHVHNRGISRKNVQPYMAAVWCFLDRAFWSAGSLLKRCAKTQPKNRHEIRNYVSPPLVKVLPA